MLIYKFYEEFDNLTEKRQVQGLKALFAEIESDPEQYEDIVLDYLDIAFDEGVVSDGVDLETVRNLFDHICNDLENTVLIYEILDVAEGYEAEDYFGTEGLEI